MGIYKGNKPSHRSEPLWDTSRNVNVYGKRLYPVTASSLKHLGAIYDIGEPVDDDEGGYTFNSVKRCDAWMSIVQLRVEQSFDYRGKQVMATHLIKVRYETTVKESDCIVIDGKTYEVISISEDTDRKAFKTILVTELRNVDGIILATTTITPTTTI